MELPRPAPNCRKELARFSSTLLSPWHNSSQSTCLFDDRSTVLSISDSDRTVSAPNLFVVVDPREVVAGVADADPTADPGSEAALDCGDTVSADADHPNDFDARLGSGARFKDEFSQK